MFTLIFTVIGTYAALIGLVLTLGEKLDGWMDQGIRRRIGESLNRGITRGPDTWLHAINEAFLNIFDRLYGGRNTTFESIIWAGLLLSPASLLPIRLIQAMFIKDFNSNERFLHRLLFEAPTTTQLLWSAILLAFAIALLRSIAVGVAPALIPSILVRFFSQNRRMTRILYRTLLTLLLFIGSVLLLFINLTIALVLGAHYFSRGNPAPWRSLDGIAEFLARHPVIAPTIAYISLPIILLMQIYLAIYLLILALVMIPLMFVGALLILVIFFVVVWRTNRTDTAFEEVEASEEENPYRPTLIDRVLKGLIIFFVLSSFAFIPLLIYAAVKIPVRSIPIHPIKAMASSIIFVLIVTLLIGFFVRNIAAQFVEDIAANPALLAFVAFNLFADGISLLETRWVLRRGANARTLALAGLLAFDIAASIIVFMLLPTFLGELETFWDALFFKGKYPWLSIFLWTTFSTSFLFYLFVISALFVGPLSRLANLFRIVSTPFNLQVHPFRCIAISTALIITTSFVVMGAAISMGVIITPQVAAAGSQ